MRVKWNTGVAGPDFSIVPGTITDSRDPHCPFTHATLMNYVADGACDALDDEDKDAGVVETAMAAPPETAMKAPAKARKAPAKAREAKKEKRGNK